MNDETEEGPDVHHDRPTEADLRGLLDHMSVDMLRPTEADDYPDGIPTQYEQGSGYPTEADDPPPAGVAEYIAVYGARSTEADDLPIQLRCTHGSYVKRMSDGQNSIIVRTKEEELDECYRLMRAAAARIRELESDRADETDVLAATYIQELEAEVARLTEAIRKHRAAYIVCEGGAVTDKALWSVLDD